MASKDFFRILVDSDEQMLMKLAKIHQSRGLSKEQRRQAQILMERNPDLIEKKEKGIKSRPRTQNKAIITGTILCAIFC